MVTGKTEAAGVSDMSTLGNVLLLLVLSISMMSFQIQSAYGKVKVCLRRRSSVLSHIFKMSRDFK